LVQCALYYTRSLDAAVELAQAILAEAWLEHGHDVLWFDEEKWKDSLAKKMRDRLRLLRRQRERRRERETAYGEEITERQQTAADPEETRAAREIRERLEAAVVKLPPARRNAYRLHQTGLSHKEIGQYLGITPGSSAVEVAKATAF